MFSFPTWLLIALGGHIANGAAFVIDKTLLNSSFRRPATYASMIGLLSVVVAVLLPFGVHVPSATNWLWIVLGGVTFVLALWAFFQALAIGEASRVVPIIGSLIPILTLVGTATFLAERLTVNQLCGFALLIVATVILSGGNAKSRVTPNTIGMAMLAATLFAISSLAVKIGYETEGFLTTFTLSRLVGVATACSILFIDTKAYDEMKRAFFAKPTNKKKQRSALGMVILAQGLGSCGFILVQYAMSLGSAAIVNALQAVQYALLVIVAFLFAKKAPTLLGEDITTRTVIRKSIALIFVAIGLWFVV